MLAGDGSSAVQSDTHGWIWWEAEGSLATLEPAAFSAFRESLRESAESPRPQRLMALGDSIFGRDQKIRRLRRLCDGVLCA